MGRVFVRAIEAAGLVDYRQRALSGQGLSASDTEHLRGADLLLVAGLADEVRAEFRGEDVRILSSASSAAQAEPKLVVFDVCACESGLTGAEVLRELALLRLTTPADTAVAVSFEALGLELAQTALLFGADVLLGDLGSARTLPLLDGPIARRRELEGLVARSGRRARFAESPEPARDGHTAHDALEQGQHP
jgi:hypothetical protein